MAQVEKDPYCLKVLSKHWPDVPKWESDETVGRHNLPAARLVAGGPPCQPFSAAGQQRGASDPRNRWPQMRRIIAECRPDWVVFENVPGIIGLYLDVVLADLETEGYATGTVVFPVASLGAPHLRQRVWIIAHALAYSGEQRLSASQSDGRDVPNAKRHMAREVRRQSEQQHSVGVQRTDVPDATCLRRERDGAARNGGTGLADGGQTAAHADPERLEGGLSQTAAWKIADTGGGRIYDSHWAIEPPVGRMADGLPGRVDRLRGLGNAVSPAQSYHVGRLIMAVEAAQNER